MNLHRRVHDAPHPMHTPGVGWVLLANALLWTAVALAVHGCVA